MRQAGFSWKKCKKLLAKAKPEPRQEYITQLSEMFVEMCDDRAIIIYIDEAHFHQDLDLGYSWSKKGVPQWIKSFSPGRSAKVNYYGAYDFTRGRCFIWQCDKFRGDNTVAFFQELAAWLGQTEQKTVYVILDGAPWHRSYLARDAAIQLGLTLVRLPRLQP